MIRTAILGLGNVAERIHIPACQAVEGIEIVAASEPREERRSAIARQFGIRKSYADSAELIERERPDLVIVGTPPDSHHALTMLALQSGADVICEKPFMSTVEEADQVIAEARRLGRVLGVNTQYRYMPIYRQTRARIERGEFGRLYFLQCWQQMFHPPAFEKLAWRAALRQSTLFEFGAHPLDLICSFFGALPESVTAHVPLVRKEFPSDVLVQATLRFPEERLATIALNRVSQAPERYLEMRLDCDEASLRLSLGGVARAGVEMLRHRGVSRPVVRLGMVRGGEARAERGTRSTSLVREKSMAFASATAEHLRDFLQRREHRSDPAVLAPAEHARDILRVVFAGYDSAHRGETVRLAWPGGASGPSAAENPRR